MRAEPGLTTMTMKTASRQRQLATASTPDEKSSKGRDSGNGLRPCLELKAIRGCPRESASPIVPSITNPALVPPLRVSRTFLTGCLPRSVESWRGTDLV